VEELSTTTDQKISRLINYFYEDEQLLELIEDTKNGIEVEKSFLFFKWTEEQRRENAIYGYVEADGDVVVVGTAQAAYAAQGDTHNTAIPSYTCPSDATPFVIHTHPWDENMSNQDVEVTNMGNNGIYNIVIPVDADTIQVMSPNEGQAYEGSASDILGIPEE
jgi:hypothetical protein